MSIESFIGPKHNYPFLWFMDTALGSLLNVVHNITDVVISAKDKEMLRDFKDKRLIYISNHPSTKEPPVTYVVSKYTYSRFYYMASREVFDWGYGFVGNVIQAIGAYSIIAGSADRESLKTTRGILAAPAGKLALFPEGEPTGAENDNLLPFQTGVTQLGFWGYEDALKLDSNAEIYVLPAFVKYRIDKDISEVQKEVDTSLEKLEKHYNLTKSGKTIEERLIGIGTALIRENEILFGIKPDSSLDFDYRIGQLRHKILNHVADTVGLKKFNRDAHAIDKLRQILSIFELVQVGVPDPKGELPSKESAKWGRKYCQKAYDLISLKSSYILDFPTPERIYEWIYRFESEAFGSFQQRPHKAFVSFAEPLKLSQYYSQYKSSKNKKEIVEGLTNTLRENIQALLDIEKKKSYRLFPIERRF
jgi:hypothetical protein